MSNIKLDLKHFKHVGSDDKSTTLQHKDGHTITLAHKALSEPSQKQLMALAQMSKDSQKPQDKSQAAQEQQARDPNSVPSRQMQAPQAFSLGGDVMDYLDNFAKKRYDAMEGDTKSTIPTPTVDPNKVKKYGIEQDAEGGVTGKNIIPDSLTPTDPVTEASTIDLDPAHVKMPEQDTTNEFNQNKEYLKSLSEDPTGSGVYQPTQDEVEAAAINKLADRQRDTKQTQEDVSKNMAEREQRGRDAASLGVKMPGQVASAAPVANPGIFNPDAQQAPKQAAPDTSGMPGLDATENMVSQGLNSQLQGIKGVAKQSGILGQAQQGILDKQAKAQQDAMLEFKNHYDTLETERQNHIQDIKDGYIDPEQYWKGDSKGNGSHSKIAAGIGMILAGFNPAGGQNQAVQFLQKQMDMNLDAQKTNLNQKNNLLAENLRQFGNLKDATAMTKVMMTDALATQLDAAAAKNKGPMAQALAQQAKGQLMMSVAPQLQTFALRRAMISAANDPNEDPSDTSKIEHLIGYSRLVNPEMAKEMESRLIPGVGLAKVPLTGQDREQILSHQKLQNAGDDLLQYSKTHSNIIPGTPEYTFGVTKAMAFQQMVREGLLGTVFRESEKPLLEKFVKENPAGAFKAFTTQPQLKAIMQSNQMSLNTLKSEKGLPIKQAPQTQQQDSGPGPIIVNSVTGKRQQLINRKWTDI